MPEPGSALHLRGWEMERVNPLWWLPLSSAMRVDDFKRGGTLLSADCAHCVARIDTPERGVSREPADANSAGGVSTARRPAAPGRSV